MPSAVDFEGRAFDYVILRNATVRNCTFKDIGVGGGRFGVLFYFWKSNGTNTKPYQNFLIEGNRFENCAGIEASSPITAAVDHSSHNIVLRNNTFKNIQTEQTIFSLKGVRFESNVFEDFTKGFQIGYGGAAFDFQFTNNTFKNIATAETTGTVIDCRFIDGISVKDNSFINCGRSDNTAGVIFKIASGAFTAYRVSLLGNKIYATNARTKYFVEGSTSWDQKTSTYQNNQIINSGSGAATLSSTNATFARITDYGAHGFDQYSMANVPNDFPLGITHATVYGGTHPTGGVVGMIETYIAPREGGGGVEASYQIYRPIGSTALDQAAFWQRRPPNGGTGTTWDAWKKFQGV